MVALGFALLLGVIALFALGCWLDRPGLFEGGASDERLRPASRPGVLERVVERPVDASVDTIAPQPLFDTEVRQLRLGEEAA
jgi:hypothetical protein